MNISIKAKQLRDIDVQVSITMTVREMKDLRSQLRNTPPSSDVSAAMDIAIAKFDASYTSEVT